MEAYDVSVVSCPDYEPETARKALAEAIGAVGGFDWVTPGMKIAVKANLITALKPETAATTHPALLAALVRLLTEKGAEVRVGDSPGGVFSKPYVDRVYAVCGLEAVKEAGGSLNEDYSIKDCHDPDCKVLKSFTYTGWLDWADVILSFSKLKVHAMMSMTAPKIG